MADPDLQIRGKGGGGHPDPEIRGGGGSFLKNVFRPFGPQFGPKIRGGPGPPGPFPGSASEIDVFSPQAKDLRIMRIQYSEGINFDWLDGWRCWTLVSKNARVEESNTRLEKSTAN